MNTAAHQLTAGAIVGLFVADREQKSGQTTFPPVAAAIAASVLTKLPDVLEPATSPHHRQFFHGLVFAAGLGVALYKLHEWDAQDPAHKFVKALGMLAISAYLIHLALDATTAKSLPLIGEF